MDLMLVQVSGVMAAAQEVMELQYLLVYLYVQVRAVVGINLVSY